MLRGFSADSPAITSTSCGMSTTTAREGLPVDPKNAQPIFDPMRKAGLTREHLS